MLDGEIVVPVAGRFDFDRALAAHPPRRQPYSQAVAGDARPFYCLRSPGQRTGQVLVELPLGERRRRLEAFAEKYFAAERCVPPVAGGEPSSRRPTSGSRSWAATSMASSRSASTCHTSPASATGMLKIKRVQTADCVVGGFRYENAVASWSVRYYSASTTTKASFTTSASRRASGTRTVRAFQETREVDQASRASRARPRGPEPLEHGALRRMATAGAKARRRGRLRSFHGRPFPPRRRFVALASRQIAAPMHARAGPTATRRRFTPIGRDGVTWFFTTDCTDKTDKGNTGTKHILYRIIREIRGLFDGLLFRLFQADDEERDASVDRDADVAAVGGQGEAAEGSAVDQESGQPCRWTCQTC